MGNSKVHLTNTKLKDRTLWYDGSSTVDEKEISRLLSLGVATDNLYVERLTDEIRQYNSVVPKESRIKTKESLDGLAFDWNIPTKYKTLNTKEFICEKLQREIENHPEWLQKDHSPRIVTRAERVLQELKLYSQLNLEDVLRALIYIINTLQSNNIVWGVGRGSSVSSYVLYLIGVHDVDSVEYELDIADFLRIK